MCIMTAQAVAVLHRRMGMHPVESLSLFWMALITQGRDRFFQHPGKRGGVISMAGQAFPLLDWPMNDLMPRLAALFLSAVLSMLLILSMTLAITKVTLIAKIGLVPILRPLHLPAVWIVADSALIILQRFMDSMLLCFLQNFWVALIAAL